MRKIFIDGGANKGQSTENFISRFSEFKLEPENWEIYMMELNGKNQTNLTNNPSTDYSFIVLPLTNP